MHALCRLIPSEDKGVACFSARAVKTLLLDDALRPQAVSAGIANVLVTALGRWMANNSCSIEILGALQTLMWDGSMVLTLVDLGITPLLLEHLHSTELEITLLSLATLANLLACCDSSPMLSKENMINEIQESMEFILELAKSRDKTKRCYAVAALANATSHPVLAGKINALNGLVLLEDIEMKNKANLSLGGTRVAECAETAVLRLSGHIDSKIAVRKYTYKWGNKPVLELMLDPQTHGNRLQVCGVVWVLCIILLFWPLVFSHRTSAIEPSHG